MLLLRRQSKGFTRDASKQRAVVMSGAGAHAEPHDRAPAPALGAAESDEVRTHAERRRTPPYTAPNLLSGYAIAGRPSVQERCPASPGRAPAPIAAAAGAPWRTRSTRKGPLRGASPAPPVDLVQARVPGRSRSLHGPHAARTAVPACLC